ncbi:2-oxo acid dehydrogenase subunit E2, partial [Staphylococcus hominis]|uniref:2-oxo acid dehydrogenase subunit E2 n=1 Tax=Staphylococcus hominis TaxID=1290 RepID=UPI001642845C
QLHITNLIELRKPKKQQFIKHHHRTKLPFISFFTNPALAPLKKYPQLNPQIHPHHIITKQYYHIPIAVSTHDPLLLPFL